jgi:AraC-like DNA-binding protein
MNWLDPDLATPPVVGLSERYGSVVAAYHQHVRTQLILASEGSLTVLTEQGSWVLPPNRALLIPGGIDHALRLRRPALFRTLYFDARVEWVPQVLVPRVAAVPQLLRELIVAMVEQPWSYTGDGAAGRLARVLCDRLHYLDQEPVHLPQPRDPRALRIAQIFFTNPAERRPLGDLAREVGASLRTLERHFKAETNLSLGQWVQQFRLVFALERLADGVRVGDAAFEVGFDNPSSFIALFRSRFGTTPARYFA